MGLFSSKKNTPASVPIPPDILADVNVNGMKKEAVPEAPANLPIGSPSATSPFLKTKESAPQENSAPSDKFQPLTSSPEANIPSGAPQEPASASPKPFQFSDQAPIPGEIHFKDPAPAKGEAAPEAAGSPFARRPDFSKITEDQALAKKQTDKIPALKMPQGEPARAKKPFWSVTNIISIVVFILILALISGGSWYYLNTRSVEEEPIDPSIDALSPDTPEAPSPSSGTVFTDQPNYLNLDIETVTLDQIKALLEQEASKMQAEGITVPVEYLVLDSNGNPVAFSRFALLIGANTPADLVDASLEPFSLYLYIDKGALRTALAITLKAETGANFPTDKKVLPKSLRGFFYPAEYASANFDSLTFGQSSYQNNSISYTNVDEANNFSFDMSTQEGVLTVANSKDTIRAVIDKRLLVPIE